ncbi:MAG: hypothetical protein ABR530_11355 [Pyrinomonadaceae bacterium]
MKRIINIFILTISVCVASLAVTGQTGRAKPPKKPATLPAAQAPLPEATPEPAVLPGKRNGRPTTPSANAAAAIQTSDKTKPPAYSYEFTRPGFTYSKIIIEHDETGKGTISFLKEGFDEPIVDPIELSPVTLGNINSALTSLNFLDSTQSYQHAKDFSNLGNHQITIRKAGRERRVVYNWTENKDAKALMDEYRRIGNEYTWQFEIKVARESQPLQTPGMMDIIDSYLRRSEISDPTHILPFLTELSTDERLPLMARNHAAKLIKQISKK